MPYLSFKGKTAVETYHHTVPHHALEFDRELSVLEPGQNPSLEGNLIIEGDNLLVKKGKADNYALSSLCCVSARFWGRFESEFRRGLGGPME